MTEENRPEAAELLGSTALFSSLPEDALLRIASVAIPRSFAAGTAIFHAGDPGDSCYVVRKGHTRAIGEHPDGRTITLGNFGPGEVFGELSLFDAETRSATVEAMDDVEALALLGPDLRAVVTANPELGLALAAALARRLRIANQRFERRSFQTVQGRVASAISELVERRVAEGATGLPIEVIATQEEISQLAGTSRESASRFLAELARAEVIEQGRGRLRVHRPEALQGWIW